MAKLNCKCGVQISNVSSPNTVEGYLIRDLDIGEADGKSSFQIMDVARDVWECWSCGRLGISFPGKHDSTVKWYAPEDGGRGGLMDRRGDE